MLDIEEIVKELRKHPEAKGVLEKAASMLLLLLNKIEEQKTSINNNL